MTVSPVTDPHNQNAGVRFTREELEAFRGAEVPDLLGPGTRLLFVGINPGLRTAAIQTHFGKPGNRFWPALLLAGIIEAAVDVSDPMTEEVKASLVERGIGISNIVPRATARADELTTTELREGARRMVALIENVRPRVVAVLGVTAYRTAFARPDATVGRQPEPIGSAELWVVPNPSGLNAHETVDSLAAAYAEPARAAGLRLRPAHR
jgi:TDG/mug DNA glycosylase family protein